MLGDTTGGIIGGGGMSYAAPTSGMMIVGFFNALPLPVPLLLPLLLPLPLLLLLGCAGEEACCWPLAPLALLLLLLLGVAGALPPPSLSFSASSVSRSRKFTHSSAKLSPDSFSGGGGGASACAPPVATMEKSALMGSVGGTLSPTATSCSSVNARTWRARQEAR